MSDFSTTAILLKRIEYGDNDLIITFFTPEKGKISAIAKHAKKSVRRFGGILEIFSVLKLVCRNGRGKLPYLQEASLAHTFSNIRCNIRKAVYASYWAELINEWLEQDQKQEELYMLFWHVLEKLDSGLISEEMLSILFQMRFMSISGFCPNLTHCCTCGIEMDKIRENRLVFDLEQGGIVCNNCVTDALIRRIFMSKGTIKQLLWLDCGDLEKAARIRFSPQSLKESLYFLESFVSYHLGKTIRSLDVLRQLRQ
ncbi:MAG TPA: DNA repair protein RecO [Desulfobacteraceae bacterium]|nr:DNA repair protein RecO [Desulfobacteraceae bacterium]